MRIRMCMMFSVHIHACLRAYFCVSVCACVSCMRSSCGSLCVCSSVHMYRSYVRLCIYRQVLTYVR